MRYAAGYDGEEPDEALLAEAEQIAGESDVVVVFAGLPDSYESEGYDRTHLRLPPAHLALISRVSRMNPNTVVVLHNGAPVEMPWLGDVKGVLEAYLAGQAGGGAVCDLLFGKENPSGKLAETFPAYLEQNPSYLNFPGEGDVVAYREGIFIGYRYYDKKKTAPLFPFGYGLSYTTFSYGELHLSDTEMTPDKPLTVELELTNTGSRRGAETVQLYVSDIESTVVRPVRELKGFEKVLLEPGQTKRVAFRLESRAFAYYSPERGGWTVEPGEFLIEVGASSRDIRAVARVQMNTTPVTRTCPYTVNSTCGDIFATEEGREVFADLFSKLDVGVQEGDEMGESSAQMAAAMYRDMPVHALVSFTQEPSITRAALQQCIDRLNGILGLYAEI